MRRLDGFTLNELMSSGSSGEVWRARPQAGGADVVLRWLDADAIDVDKLEASELRGFHHPHVAGLLDIRRDTTSVVLVHQFIGGMSLAALLGQRERLSGPEVVTLLTPLADALADAHDVDLLHADLTPTSVMVTPDGRPILTDLGIRQVLVGGALDGPGATRLEYLDPSVARGGHPTPASDVFAVAALGYRALTGRPPWPLDGAGSWTAQDADPAEVDLTPLLTDSSARLADVIAKGLSVRPDLRGGARDFALGVRAATVPEPLDLNCTYVWPDLPLAPEPTDDDPPTAGRARGKSGMDIASAVRRGSVARHSAPAPAGRERAAARNRFGLDRPSRLRTAARLARRRPGVAALLALTAMCALLVGRGWDAGQATPAQAGALVTPAPSAATTLDERASPGTAEGWVALLNLLYQRRALAYETGDPALLDQVFTPDSPQLLVDRVEVTRLAAAGQVLRAFTPHVSEVLDVDVNGLEARLRVTDQFEAYQIVAATQGQGEALASQAGRGPAAVDLLLKLTAQGWRVHTAVLVA